MSRSYSVWVIGCVVALMLSACGSPASGAATPQVATPGRQATVPADVVPIGTATPSGAGRSATVSELLREVVARPLAAMDWRAAALGNVIEVGGGVRTGDDARARLDLSDGTLVRIAPATQFTLVELSAPVTDPVTRFVLEAGKLWVAVTKSLGDGTFEIETPTGVATVRGSLMSVEYSPATGHTLVSCLEGQCRLTGQGGDVVDLAAGEQSSLAGAGQAPAPAQPLDAAQLADWAAEFPEAAAWVAETVPGPWPAPAAAPGVITAGHWRERYGDTTRTGECLDRTDAGGDGGGAADLPLLPARAVEGDAAILVYDVDQRYDRVSPGVYRREAQFDYTTYGGEQGVITITLTLRDELRVVSQGELAWHHETVEQGGCTTAFTKTLTLQTPDATVLLTGAAALTARRGDYTATWGQPQCSTADSALPDSIPQFDRIAVTAGYDDSLVLYGRGHYYRLALTESLYTHSLRLPDGVTVMWSIAADEPLLDDQNRLQLHAAALSADFQQTCAIPVELQRLTVVP